MGKEIVFTPPKIVSSEELEVLRGSGMVERDLDIFDRQIIELSRIKSPDGASSFDTPPAVYVYFPWSKTLLKTVGSELLITLRTNRNRELISSDEQQRLAKSVIGVVGMSVGSGIAMSVIQSGISSEIKIADYDVLDNSNLNRLRESLTNIGRPKSHLTAEKIYEVDPFAKVHVFDNGINNENIDKFFSDPNLDLVIDEIDDFKQKLQLRLKAKQYEIPLLMFTSLGDNILVDIERYDSDANQKIFNGILNEDLEEKLVSDEEISEDDEKSLAVQLVGPNYVPTRALQSVQKIGKELVGRPQLYSTIAVDGGLAAYVARQILLNNKPESGRYFIKFNELFNLENTDFDNSQVRQTILSSFQVRK